MMATYRPIKKWLIPLLAVAIGFSIGFSFLPSEQEYHYKKWHEAMEKAKDQSYEMQILYVRDEAVYSESTGFWSKDRSNFHISTPVSDDTTFEFDIYLEEKEFFVYSGGGWYKGDLPHRVVEELSPMDQPFEWVQSILKAADKITKNEQGDTEIYKAVFHSFNDIEFQGVLLKEQLDTTLTMELKDDHIVKLTFKARPKRPEEVPILNSYPEILSYEILLSPLKGQIPKPPQEAFSGEKIE